MEIDKQIYEILWNHYREKFSLSAPYENDLQKWALLVTGVSFMLLLCAAALQIHLFRPSVATFGLWAYIVFIIAFLIYAIAYMWMSLREVPPTTPGYMRTMIGRIEKERALVEKLQPYSTKQLKNTCDRLKYELESQDARLSYIFGAASKLGLVPAVFAMYALYRKTQAEDLPYNIGVVFLAAIVGLSLGAFLVGAVSLKFKSMIYVLDEAISQKSGDNA